MIELLNDSLVFSFPDVHRAARLTISFKRTLRIPDDGNAYPLPPGLARFPLLHVDDFAKRVPPSWVAHGGVMLPMHQAEAMWINFMSDRNLRNNIDYPFAVKIGTGKINAVSGDTWRKGLHRKPSQDYVVVPEQPWLDGYCTEKGFIRQFVAMPLGAGYSAEEQITGNAEYGGLQIQVFPMKRKVYKKRFPALFDEDTDIRYQDAEPDQMMICEMGLALGGRMRQSIEEDTYNLSDWDLGNTNRCYVHIANAMDWRAITGKKPPTMPPTADEYTKAGLPWFDWYDDKTPVRGSKALAALKSIAVIGKKRKQEPLPENKTVKPGKIISLRKRRNKDEVREFLET